MSNLHGLIEDNMDWTGIVSAGVWKEWSDDEFMLERDDGPFSFASGEATIKGIRTSQVDSVEHIRGTSDSLLSDGFMSGDTLVLFFSSASISSNILGLGDCFALLPMVTNSADVCSTKCLNVGLSLGSFTQHFCTIREMSSVR